MRKFAYRCLSLTNDTLSYVSKVFDNTSETTNHTLWLNCWVLWNLVVFNSNYGPTRNKSATVLNEIFPKI